jgi:hypothetical protein
MPSLFSEKRKLYQIIAALGMVFCLVFYYYAIYIPDKEETILSQKYRTLNQLKLNIVESLDAYSNVLNSIQPDAAKTTIDSLILKHVVEDALFDSIIPIDTLIKTKGWYIENDKFVIPGRLESSQKIASTSFLAKIKIEKVLSRFTISDAFSGYMFLKDRDVLVSTLSLGMNPNNFLPIVAGKKSIQTSFDTIINFEKKSYRFFYFPFKNKNENLSLAGLYDNEKFSEEKKSVNSETIAWICLVLIFLLIMLPFIKLQILGKRERLGYEDLLGVSFSGIAFFSIIIIGFLVIYSQIKFNQKDRLGELQNSIYLSVINEMKTESEFLEDLINKKNELKGAKSKKIIVIDSSSIKSSVSTILFDSADSNYSTSMNKYNAELIFKVNGDGSVESTWEKVKDFTYWKPGKVITSNLRDRNYFKVLSKRFQNNENEWAYEDFQSHDKINDFIVEPLISRSSGKLSLSMVGIIPDSARLSLLGLLFSPSAFNNPVLPNGYMAAIIDKKGKVIYHSDNKKNFNEDLKSEFLNYESLNKAICQDLEEFNTQYYGDLVRCKVKPLLNTGFYILVMEKQEVMNASMVRILSHVSTVLFIFILIYAVLIYIVYLIYIRIAKYSISVPKFIKFYPRISYQNSYLICGIFNLFLSIVLIISAYFVFNFDYSNYLIYIVYLVTIPLSIFVSYKFLNDKNSRKKWFLSFLILVIRNIEIKWIIFIKKFKLNKLFSLKERYIHKYSFFILSIILLYFVFPVFYTYKYWDKEITEDVSLKDFEKYLDDWKIRDGVNLIKQGNGLVGKPFIMGIINESEMAKNNEITVESDSVSYAGFYINAKDKSTNFFNWQENMKQDISWQICVFFLLFLVFIIWGIILFISAIYKLFAARIEEEPWDNLKEFEALLKGNVNYLFCQGPTGSNKKGYVKELIAKSFKDSNNLLVEIDLLELPDEKNDSEEFLKKEKELWVEKLAKLTNVNSGSIVLISHFEYNFLDLTTNRIKLNLIERLSMAGAKKLIILSSMDPTEFLSVLEQIGQLDKSDKNNLEMFKDLDRWKILFGKFVNVYLRLNLNLQPIESNSFITNEFNSAYYLKRIEQSFSMNFDLNDVGKVKAENHFYEKYLSQSNKELHMINLQFLAVHYFRDLWHSLNPEEKIIIYDIAEDNIFNSTNLMVLYGLKRKGLVTKQDGIFMLFSETFRQYILSNVHKAEIRKVSNGIKGSSLWMDYRGPLLIVFISLVWFIFYSNQDKYGNLVPILTGLAAAVPALVKFISYFTGSGAKQ